VFINYKLKLISNVVWVVKGYLQGHRQSVLMFADSGHNFLIK